MGFSSGKKIGQQYCKKLLLQLPYPPSNIRHGESDDTDNGCVLRSSSKDDISVDSGSGGIPMPLMASDRLNVSDGVSYYLDHLHFSKNSPCASRNTIFPLQPDLASHRHHPFAPSLASPKAATSGCSASYQWYLMGETPRYDDITLSNSEVLKPYFSFGTVSVPGIHDADFNGDDECEENVSLLHGGSKMGGNSIFKPPRTKQDFSSSSSSPRDQKTTSLCSESGPCSEDSTCLMSKTNDWSERQLAFDLDSVVDEDEDHKCGFEHALWMLQMEEDSIFFQRVPPPPLVSNHYDERIACVNIDRNYNSTSMTSGNTTVSKVSASSLTDVAKNTNVRTRLEVPKAGHVRGQSGNQKKRSPQQYRRAHELHCRNRTVLTKKTTRPSSKTTSNRRRRRSWYRGADFSPKLSTVTEQPSKEDEASTDDDTSTTSATLETSSASSDFCDAETSGLHEC